MTHFAVASNELSGTIPASVGNWRAIEFFDVRLNKLSGLVPDMEFGKMDGNCHLLLDAVVGRFACPWPAGAKAACQVKDDQCTGTAPPTPPTQRPTPAPAYLCDTSTYTCQLDAAGTQQQELCHSTCTPPPTPAPPTPAQTPATASNLPLGLGLGLGLPAAAAIVMLSLRKQRSGTAADAKGARDGDEVVAVAPVIEIGANSDGANAV